MRTAPIAFVLLLTSCGPPVEVPPIDTSPEKCGVCLGFEYRTQVGTGTERLPYVAWMWCSEHRVGDQLEIDDIYAPIAPAELSALADGCERFGAFLSSFDDHPEVVDSVNLETGRCATAPECAAMVGVPDDDVDGWCEGDRGCVECKPGEQCYGNGFQPFN